MYGVSYDYKDDIAGGVTPPPDYLGELAYATWNPATTPNWGPISIIRTDIAGSTSPKALLGACKLAFASDGKLRATYRVLDFGSTSPPILIYAHEFSTGWTFTNAGEGHYLTELELGAAGEIFVSVDSPSGVDLVRVNVDDSITRKTVKNYFGLGFTSSVWRPTATDTVCRVLSTDQVVPGESRFVLSTFQNCEQP